MKYNYNKSLQRENDRPNQRYNNIRRPHHNLIKVDSLYVFQTLKSTSHSGQVNLLEKTTKSLFNF
ncbi:hypothetical protein M153_3192000914 [Pseudoloma neurophilia]|uniref:Uncharacterized protein n=1 Tax=Pseudoloma neurophilia TaxID=146866 RepID=A0A0R0LTD4_9MICR|nr:hypothetical protein M153_3192000914 [Pseudoloma neurophilia]